MADNSEKSNRRLTLNPKACTGCRTCELACSFHHNKVFDPSASSIKVMEIKGDGTLKLTVLNTCDLCLSEKAPFCVRYCASGCLGVTSARGQVHD